MKSSSSQNDSSRLREIPLDKLVAHPSNSNHMPVELKQKLAENIRLTGEYPPLIVRPTSGDEDTYQLIDGHQRADALREIGTDSATCYVWPCDDRTALHLLATLNRLEGQDVPVKRAALLSELSALSSTQELSLLLPESSEEIEQTLKLLDFDIDSLISDLESAAQTRASASPRLISFAVDPEDEEVVMAAVEGLAKSLSGKNRRGRAIAEICKKYLENSTSA